MVVYLPLLAIYLAIYGLAVTSPAWGGAVGGFLVTRRPLVGALVLAPAAWVAWKLVGSDDWRAFPSFLFLPAVIAGVSAGVLFGRRPPVPERSAPRASRPSRPGPRCACGVAIAPVAHAWNRMGYCSRRCWERVSREGGG